MNGSTRKTVDKYWTIFCLSLQQEFYYRASFVMDRARSITIVIAFYAFWSVLFQGRTELLGYTQSQMFTYILGMNVLRALIFSDKTWEMIRDINIGKISTYLVRPVSYIGYEVSRDLADKTVNSVSALIEVALAVWILKITFYSPQQAVTFLYFGASLVLAMVLFFLMSYTVSSFAFWTAESAGPRFCFELFIEFMAGAFFPLDVLPQFLRDFFQMLPFASLIHFPLNVFLERVPPEIYFQRMSIGLLWAVILFFVVRFVWTRGLKIYAAEGG